MDKTAEVLKQYERRRRVVLKEKIKKILVTGRAREFVEELIYVITNSEDIDKVEIIEKLSVTLKHYRYSADLRKTVRFVLMLLEIVMQFEARVIVDNIHSKINGGE